jgi:hypothetical protein
MKSHHKFDDDFNFSDKSGKKKKKNYKKLQKEKEKMKVDASQGIFEDDEE